MTTYDIMILMLVRLLAHRYIFLVGEETNNDDTIMLSTMT